MGYPNDFDENTVLITWNCYHVQKRIGQRLRDKGGQHIVMENGYLKRGEYFAISKDNHMGLGWTPQGDNSRWKALNIELKPWKKDGNYVLICGQRGGKYSELAMPSDWPDTVISELRQHTDRQLIYRPHPGRQLLPKTKIAISPSERPIEEFLGEAYAVVVYVSNSATMGLIHGVPAFYCGPSTIAKELCLEGISKINNPIYPNREPVFEKIAWAQWSRDEIEKGIPWRYLLD